MTKEKAYHEKPKTKKEIIIEASKISGVSQKTMGICFKAILETLTKSINDGYSVTISNFGVFKVKVQTERYSMNPKNGLTFLNPEKRTVKFKRSPGLIRPEDFNKE